MQIDKHVSLLFHRADRSATETKIIDILVYILIVLGFIGNLFGLVLFSSSRRTWRISSIYVRLATSSSIINLFCVVRYASLLHSTWRNFLSDLIGTRWWPCKIYEFSFVFRAISSWITLFWMFERLLCVSNRLQSFFNYFCRSKFKFILPFLVVLFLLGWIIGPAVYFFEPTVISDDLIDVVMDKNRTYCELPQHCSPLLHKYFHEIRLGFNHFTVRCVFSELIPTAAVLLFNTYIIYHLIRIDRGVYRDEHRTMSWMNGVLLIHSFLFLASLFAHIIGHFTITEAHESWWVLLAILINSSVNFYLYCLSGKAFRNEIIRFINKILCLANRSCHERFSTDEIDPNQTQIPLQAIYRDD